MIYWLNGRMRLAHLGLVCIATTSVCPAESSAQIIDQSTVAVPPRPQRPSSVSSAYTNDRDTPVLEQLPPIFMAQGVNFGPVEAFPGLMIAPEYISNIYANNSNRKGDLAVLLRPELTLRNRGGRVDIDLFGRGVISRYINHASENTEEGVGGASLSLPVSALSYLIAGASYAQRVLPRYAADSPIGANEPLRYTELLSNIGGKVESGQIRLSLRGNYQRLRFDNYSVGGATVSAQDRDRSIVSGSVKAEYAFKPDESIYVAATYNRVNYALPLTNGLSRNSHGGGLFVGASLDVTNLIRADARVGYIRQIFDAGGVRDISGLGLLGSLTYFATRLTTVTVRAERSIRDSGVPGTTGNVHTEGDVQVDHALRRYLTLTGTTGYYTDVYRGTARTDRNAFAALSAIYLSRNHWNAKVGYQYARRHCDCVVNGAEFDDNRVLVALTLQK